MTLAPCWAAIAASSAVLPPGPAHRSSQRPLSSPVDRRQRQRPGHQLAALVLHQRLAVAQGREPAGVAAAEVDRIGRVAADLAVHRLGQVRGGQHTGASGQVHRRPGVVGGQGGVEFARVGTEGVGERLGDPARVGVHERGVAHRVLGRRWSQLGQPGGLVAAGNPA